jgi:hypothetical protein
MPSKRPLLQADKTPLTVVGALALLALAGCGPSGGATNGAAAVNAEAAGAPGYQAPPELTGAAVLPDGRLELSGVAGAGQTVRLLTPAGQAAYAPADGRGRWTLDLPAATEPRLLSLSTTIGQRIVQAQGYLFIAPGGAAVRLRAGGGSERLDAKGAGLAPLTLDYDAQRAATVSGRAAPGEPVSLRLDGVEHGQADADEAGRFVVTVNQTTAGDHEFDVVSPSGEAEFHAAIDPPRPLAGTLFAAAPQGGGWRIDWVTPGGGEQTTLLLGPSHPSPPPTPAPPTNTPAGPAP